MASRERELLEMLEPEILAQGVQLVELGIGSAGRREVLRLIVHSEAGVSHGDCARVTRAVARLLEEKEDLVGSYVLEVSSPGTDRVFKHEREFEVFAGRRVRLWTAEEAPREYVGTAQGTGEEGQVVLKGDDGETVQIPWTSISKARLVPEERDSGRRSGES